MASRFGRDAIGIGGGAPSPGVAFSEGRVAGIGGGVSVDLFIPKESAEGRGGGKTCDLCGWTSCWTLDSCLMGRGGLEGN